MFTVFFTKAGLFIRVAPVYTALLFCLVMASGTVIAADQTSPHDDEELSGFSTFLVNNAYMAIRDNKLHDARSFIQRALETQPNHLRLLEVMADIVERQEDWAEADAVWSRVVERDASHSYAFARRGFVRIHLERPEEARADFIQALANQPDEEVRDTIEKAIANLTPVMDDHEDKLEMASTVDEPEAGLAEAALEPDPDVVAELEADGDWAGLEALYEHHLLDDPDNLYYLSGRGFARLDAGRESDAEADFRTALRQNPSPKQKVIITRALESIEHSRAAAQLVEGQRIWNELEKDKKWSELERHLTGLLDKAPEWEPILAARGFARYNQEKLEAAEQDFNEVLAGSPDTTTRQTVHQALRTIEADKRLAKVSDAVERLTALQEQEEWDKIVILANDILVEQPNNATFLAARGFARLRLRDFDDAKQDFQNALSMTSDPVAKENLQAALRQVDDELALQEKERNMAQQIARQERIQQLEKAGDDEALTLYLNQVLDENREDAYALASRGFLHSRREEFEAAKRDFLAAVAISPDSDLAKNASAGLESVEREIAAKQPQPPGPADKLQEVAKHIADKEYAVAAALLAEISEMETSPAESAQAGFYRGELLWVEERFDEAYPLYEAALPNLATEFLQSECLWRMADYNRKRENRDLAMVYAARSAELLPDNGVRNSEVGYLFLGYLQDPEAIFYFERALQHMTPTLEQAGIYMDLGYAYKRQGDRAALDANIHRYVDLMTVKIDQAGPAALQSDVENTYAARRVHADLTRKFGVFSGLYSYRRDNGDYAVQQINDFYWQPWYNNGRYVQAYFQTIGTLTAKYSSRVYEPTTDTYGGFNSSSHLNDSFHTVAGVRVDPSTSLNLVFAVEKIFKIGRQTRDDVRVRLAHSWDRGLELEPCKTNWLYVTLFNEALYSIEHDNFTYVGEARVGRSYRLTKINPRLVATPFAGTSYGYQGRGIEKSERWYAEAGPGIHFRKWYREDKYNAPQSYLDVIVQYRFGLTNRRENILAFNIFHSF